MRDDDFPPPRVTDPCCRQASVVMSTAWHSYRGTFTSRATTGKAGQPDAEAQTGAVAGGGGGGDEAGALGRIVPPTKDLRGRVAVR